MAKHQATPISGNKKRSKPATTPEERENQLISLAYDLVEQRLLDGTATSQETTHFLKMGSEKERLEREKLREENEALRAKTESLRSAVRMEETYKNALKAMREYSGQGVDDEDEYDDEEI